MNTKPHRTLSQSVQRHLLAIPDLTLSGNHAIAQMVKVIHASAQQCLPDIPCHLVKGSRMVLAEHNYDMLGYPKDAIVQASHHTHWLDDRHILRTQTTSIVLEALMARSGHPEACILLAPGMVYRRDVRDRWHCGQPHQMDVWCLLPRSQMSPDQLQEVVLRMAKEATGASEILLQETSHPYTQEGVEISARWDGRWLEIGEAGWIDPGLLRRLGIDAGQWGGLAMGWGLDRLVMVHKRLPDIRLLRDPLASVVKQMCNLSPWVPVSRQPVAIRELSLACSAGISIEALTAKVLEAVDEKVAACIQSVEVAGRWSAGELPPEAIQRLGMQTCQENILLKVSWQSESTSLPRQDVNRWMENIYRAIHQGTEWAYCPTKPAEASCMPVAPQP